MIKKHKKNFRKHTFFQEFFSLFMLFYMSIIIFLIVNTILNSLKSKSELALNIIGFPKNPTLDNYRVVLIEDRFLFYILNSLFLTITAVCAVLVVSSMVAYGLSRYKFKGKNLLQIFFLLGLMFPIQLGILPNFILLRSMHLINNFLGMILLFAANISFPFFIFFKHFQALPYSLQDAARIDGAGEFTIFFKIMLPICRPVFITVGLITAINLWNDFYLSLVFLTEEQVRTMPLGIYKYLSLFLQSWDKVFPAVTISLLPIIILFFFSAEKIVSGLASGATKE